MGELAAQNGKNPGDVILGASPTPYDSLEPDIGHAHAVFAAVSSAANVQHPVQTLFGAIFQYFPVCNAVTW